MLADQKTPDTTPSFSTVDLSDGRRFLSAG